MFDSKDFPILQRKINGHRLAYLDNAATTQKPQQVIDALTHYYTHINANVHRGIHTLSEESSELYEQSRATTARFINAKPEQIVFTSGTTESINLVAATLRPRRVATSILEHHSNFVPWQQVAEKFTTFMPGQNPPPADLIAITGMSNVTGEKPKIPNSNAKIFLDAAQLAAHEKIDVKKLDVDFLAFSAHKMLGPTGLGVLYIKDPDALPPYQFGGGMVREVTESKTTFATPPSRFEAGTPNIAGAIAFTEALKYLEKVGLHNIAKHTEKLGAQTIAMLKKFQQIKVQSLPTTSIVSFTIDGIHPHDISEILNQNGIAIRAGHHCCQPLMLNWQVPATCRASFYLYNTEQDIEQLEKGLKKCIETFN